MIRFENVTKRYRGTQRPALDAVDFEIERGEFVFLVGASGSGKSSCLRLILREDTPSDGRVLVLGRDTRSLSDRRTPFFRRSIGAVFQDFRLLPSKTVAQNISFALKVIGRSRAFIKSAVPEALERVGLEGMGKRMPHELSGGEQQRIAIARAIVNRPQLLLADEPTGNLDPTTSVEVMRVLEAIHAGGTTVVMATHEAGFVDKMQRRVIELSAGDIVRDERSAGYGAELVRDEMRGSYGDTSAVSTLRAEPERGAAAIAALTAALEVQREVAGPTEEPDGDGEDTRPEPSAEGPVERTDTDGGAAAAAEDERAQMSADVPEAETESAEENVAPEDEAPSRSAFPAVDVHPDELGMADRLGLPNRDDDEVGPTS